MKRIRNIALLIIVPSLCIGIVSYHVGRMVGYLDSSHEVARERLVSLIVLLDAVQQNRTAAIESAILGDIDSVFLEIDDDRVVGDTHYQKLIRRLDRLLQEGRFDASNSIELGQVRDQVRMRLRE